MSAGTTLIRPIIVDSVDHLLVDIATGRHLAGDAVHPELLAAEHGLPLDEAREALDDAWRLGFVSKVGAGSCGLVAWTPEASQLQLHRLARAMVTAVAGSQRATMGLGCVIDGERTRLGAVEHFGLTVPCDVELFLELARALLGDFAPTLLDELIAPLEVMFSDAATTVHGLEFAAPAEVRHTLVCDLVRSLMDGRVDDFRDLVADYVVALSVD
jgi:hypothetical protein